MTCDCCPQNASNLANVWPSRTRSMFQEFYLIHVEIVNNSSNVHRTSWTHVIQTGEQCFFDKRIASTRFLNQNEIYQCFKHSLKLPVHCLYCDKKMRIFSLSEKSHYPSGWCHFIFSVIKIMRWKCLCAVFRVISGFNSSYIQAASSTTDNYIFYLTFTRGRRGSNVSRRKWEWKEGNREDACQPLV